ncbi:Cof-type HAD-IIB family hydrolase [Bacillus rhizoplanae]|uniref:Cof-type HAD-IIB family hydrolase n=1 Tax=Bacillus rhizoplanae TaxID=2880966 RepID=UPI003D19DE49
MKKQHLIALDLDGTLLTDQKIISARTKQTIARAKEQGHIVVISTGRPFRASHAYYKELGLNTPIVNFNGAYVHHPLDRNWGTHHSPLELATAQEIVRACMDFGVENIYAEVIDDVYVKQVDADKKHIFEFGSPKIFTGDLLDILQEHPTCLLIDAHESKSNSIRQHLTDMHAEVIDHRKWGAPWPIIEIVKSGLNKAIGLQKISSFYNIPKEHIIAFGDEDNDFEMIEFAGHGIAMGNAIPELKSLANHVTLSNEEDGIALYLEEVLGL